jgi:hypothetical protein
LGVKTTVEELSQFFDTVMPRPGEVQRQVEAGAVALGRDGKSKVAHPDRDLRFRCINDLAARALPAGKPVISVDTKKKELIGNYANGNWYPARRLVTTTTPPSRFTVTTGTATGTTTSPRRPLNDVEPRLARGIPTS